MLPNLRPPRLQRQHTRKHKALQAAAAEAASQAGDARAALGDLTTLRASTAEHLAALRSRMLQLPPALEEGGKRGGPRAARG